MDTTDRTSDSRYLPLMIVRAVCGPDSVRVGVADYGTQLGCDIFRTKPIVQMCIACDSWVPCSMLSLVCCEMQVGKRSKLWYTGAISIACKLGRIGAACSPDFAVIRAKDTSACESRPRRYLTTPTHINMPGTGVRDLAANEFVAAYSSHLKRSG